MPAVEVRSLVVRLAGRVVVDGIDLDAHAGSVTAILGPNGAGKTTTLETVEGYRRPDSGTVRILGFDPVAERAQVVGRVGVMLQRGGVYSTLGAEAVLRLFAGYHERPLPVEDLIERLGLGGCRRTPWRRLSGGEQQRVALGLALVGRPQVAFLDEPSAGMDPIARDVLWSIVQELRDEGGCVVLTTHQLEEAERLADRLVVLDGGTVVAAGSPAELSGGGEAIRFSAPPGLDLGPFAQGREVRSGEYEVDLPPTPTNVAALTAWLAGQDVMVGDLRAGRQRLEDVFRSLVGQASAAEADRAPRRRRRAS